MDKNFVVWICSFFKEQLGLDLDVYRDEETRRYDISSLLFFKWSLVPSGKRVTITKFSEKHKKRFVLNTITSDLRCFAEVKGSRGSK